MNEKEIITKWEKRFTREMSEETSEGTEETSEVTKGKTRVANMDYDYFLNLLMESRIIPAS